MTVVRDRWMKTALMVDEMHSWAMANPGKKICCAVQSDADKAMVAVRLIEWAKVSGMELRRHRGKLVWPNGARLEFSTSEDRRKLNGLGLGYQRIEDDELVMR